MTEAASQTREMTDGQPAKPRQPWLWNVVLLDDDDHTYEYVIRMVQSLFAHPMERACQVAKTVDTQGRAVCATTHKELAELKRDQVLAFGRDPLMSRSKGSMTAIIEPAMSGADDARDDHAGDKEPSRERDARA